MCKKNLMIRLSFQLLCYEDAIFQREYDEV